MGGAYGGGAAVRGGFWRWAWSCGLGAPQEEEPGGRRGLSGDWDPARVLQSGRSLQAEVGLAGAGPLQEALQVSGELRGGPGSRASTAGGGTGVQRPTRSGRGIYVEGLSPKVEPRRVAARTNQMRIRGLWAQEAGWVGALDERVLTGAEL